MREICTAGHFPSRTLIDEEEEREAQQWAGRYATPPQLKVSFCWKTPVFHTFCMLLIEINV